MQETNLEFPYQSFITPEDIRDMGGYRLEERLLSDDTDNDETTTDNFLREIARMVYEKLPPFKRKTIYADPNNVKALAECQYYQAIYILENEDLGTWNGVDGQRMIDINELRGWRNIAPGVKTILFENGWLYRGC